MADQHPSVPERVPNEAISIRPEKLKHVSPVSETAPSASADPRIDPGMQLWIDKGMPESLCGCGHDTVHHTLRGDCIVPDCHQFSFEVEAGATSTAPPVCEMLRDKIDHRTCNVGCPNPEAHYRHLWHDAEHRPSMADAALREKIERLYLPQMEEEVPEYKLYRWSFNHAIDVVLAVLAQKENK